MCRVIRSRSLGYSAVVVMVGMVQSPHAEVCAQSCTVALPARRGATVLSTQIDAQAQLILAQGEFLKSAATARRIHAEAASAEMKNSVEWVQTYFSRRQLNREYRQHPSYADRIDKLHAVEERRIIDQSWDVSRGDVTDQLNWLLEALSPTMLGPLPVNKDPRLANVDQPMSEQDIGRIVVSEGAARKGQRLTFHIVKGSPLGARWPLLLCDPVFDRQREAFDASRNTILLRLQHGEEWDWASARQLQDALDDLSDRFAEHFAGARFEPGWYRRIDQHQEYLSAKRHLETLAAGVSRLILLRNGDTLDIVKSFEGETCLELLQFMCARGLDFAPPEPGGEATYQKLFYALRNVYKQLVYSNGS